MNVFFMFVRVCYWGQECNAEHASSALVCVRSEIQFSRRLWKCSLLRGLRCAFDSIHKTNAQTNAGALDNREHAHNCRVVCLLVQY